MEQDDEQQKLECVITQHAYERAKERMRWKPSVLDKMASKALNEGITHSETKGALKRHITEKWKKYRHANNIRIYGEDLYFFCGNKLITLYRMETKFIKYIKLSQEE